MLLQNIIESKYYYQPGWVLIIIVLSLLLIGYLYSAYNSRLITFFKAVAISRFAAQVSREERSLSHPVSVLLSLNFFLTASLFALQIFSSETFFHSELEFSLASFFLIALTIFLIYFIKIVFLKIIAFIFDKQEIMAEYNFTIFLVHQFLGILLIPVVTFIAYGPESFQNQVFYAGITLIAGIFLFRIGKGISTVLQRREVTLFYLILYLCTLEILPLLIGIKLFERLS
jgi:hypothetical protein